MSDDKYVLILVMIKHYRDYIPEMIEGACNADAAVLVIPATPGEFESCFQNSGQTKEHALLVKVRELSIAHSIVYLTDMFILLSAAI